MRKFLMIICLGMMLVALGCENQELIKCRQEKAQLAEKAAKADKLNEVLSSQNRFIETLTDQLDKLVEQLRQAKKENAELKKELEALKNPQAS
ncbi:MAG: hypothetical protein JW709_06255 [Sedimentisphaerales bacterium]|nr:hypothetical protein [Sedimentisphaerales bacterium]